MRADRLLTTLLLLQAHRQLTSRQIAERLEVSARTVHRDMEALSSAGVPVIALRGARGGWCLEENWRTQVPALDESELVGLLLAQPRVVGARGLASAAERALGKLMAAMPGDLRDRARAMQQRLLVDPAGWHGQAPDELAALPAVLTAVSHDRRLTIRYRKHGADATVRTIDPLGLVAKGSAWYLVADTPAGFRTFHLSRIEEAAVLDAPCIRPRDFSLAAHWKHATAQLRLDRRRFAVTLAVDAQAAEGLRRYHDATPVAGAPSGTAADWLTVEVRFEDEDVALFVCLGMGSRVRVLAPASLRTRLESEAAAVLAARASFGADASENADHVVHARRQRDRQRRVHEPVH